MNMATFATSMALGVEKIETEFAQHKTDYFQHFKSCLLNFSKMILFTADNIPSKHLQDVRIQLRSSDPLQQSLVVMGKNTLMRRVVKSMASDVSHQSLAKLLPLIEGNIGFVFTNAQDPLSIARVIAQPVTTVAAKPGSFSPCDVILPIGTTNLSPDKTAFFRAVGINTRIAKNQVELINPITVLKKGDKVSASQSALLDLLKIRPFEYRIHIKAIYEAGEVFEWTRQDEDISSFLLKSESETQAKVENLVMRGLQQVLGLSSSLSIDAIPHSLISLHLNSGRTTTTETATITATTDQVSAQEDGETDVVDVGMMDLFGCGLEDEEEEIPKEKKKEVKEEEEEEVVSAGGFGSLFGDDEEEEEKKAM